MTLPFVVTERGGGRCPERVAFVFGFRPWRKCLRYWLGKRSIYRFDANAVVVALALFFVLILRRKSDVYVWGFKHPAFLEKFCSKFGIPFIRVEDGFVRSITLGRTGSTPLSLCFDRTGVYFDPSRPSDLENIIQTYDFSADSFLMARAEQCLAQLLDHRLSKYNTSPRANIDDVYGPKKTKRVLVLGQVEGDMSLIKGLDRAIDNNDLVRIAVRENPDAQVIYKPHPEVLYGTRTEPSQSNPNDVRGICQILEQDIALSDALQTVDHVYTMTSLSGFEALIRGIRVTCLGAPFYAGWGATDDRQTIPRRTAHRTPLEIFAAAYILYPRYFDTRNGSSIELEAALHLLAEMRSSRNADTKSRPLTRIDRQQYTGANRLP